MLSGDWDQKMTQGRLKLKIAHIYQLKMLECVY